MPATGTERRLACEKGTVIERLVDHKFAYGAGPNEVILSARVLVFECASCDEAYMGWEGADALDEAIRQHRAAMAATAA